MGFNHSSASSKISKSDLFGAVLAGFGIWTAPSPAAKTQPVPNNVHPLRVVRVKDVNPQLTGQLTDQLAGRMVISGRMADVCAELDRMAA